MRLKTFGGLWVENADSGAAGSPRPRSLAVLAILAAAGSKGASRDQIIGVLWPESSADRARHVLSQTIYGLRKELGTEVLLAAPDLRLDADRITSDVEEFRRAVREKDWAAAAALYAGPFLSGFYLSDAPDFERWAESQRASLAADGLRAIEAQARECTASERSEEAIQLRRRLTQLDPVNARYAIAYMEALAVDGERTTALAHGKAYSDLLQQEFDADADPAVQQLMARLRDVERVPASPDVISPVSAGASVANTVTVDAPVAAPALPNARVAFHRHALIAAGIVGLGVVAAIFGWRTTAVARDTPPILAVGRIREMAAPDSVEPAELLSEMLATSLSRLTDIEVIANSRMLELMPRNADSAHAAVSDVARRAGATQIIEGELIRLSGQRLRLDVRRVDLERGVVRAAYQVTGTDRVALLDSATSLVAADLRVGAPVGSLVEASTRSPTAYALYEKGLRAFYQFEIADAKRFFDAAVREDSTFVMAVYYAWRSATPGAPDQVPLAERALRLASRASARDGLLIRTHVGFWRQEPLSIAAAESLATLYPRDPEALLRAAERVPDLARATMLANRSIALDSAAGVLPGAICRLCEALSLLSHRYNWADSLDANERTLRRWIALRPADGPPWLALSQLLTGVGRRTEAQSAARKAADLSVRGAATFWDIDSDIRSDDFDAVDAQCATGLASADLSEYGRHRWACTIAMRMEGRYREAMALHRDGRVPGSGRIRRDLPADVSLAILEMEAGSPIVAADSFMAMARRWAANKREPENILARNTAWHLTLSATAAVAGGDSLRARGLIDSIEAIGRRSLYARDPQLHHFVRGLLHSRANQDLAAERALRASIVYPSNGYTRANLELGRTLLKLRRPTDGIPVVRAALHGGISGSGLYVSRTELHELLAQLFDAAGDRDSAMVHYAVVERGWRSADPFLRPRYEAARTRLATLRPRS